MKLKIFKDKEIEIDFYYYAEKKCKEVFETEATVENFSKMIERYKDEIRYLVIKEEYFSKEMLATSLLAKKFNYIAKKNEVSIFRFEDYSKITYSGKTVGFSEHENEPFYEAYYGKLPPLKTEDYEKYRKIFKIVYILIPENYGLKYRMSESEKTIKLEKHFVTGENHEVLMAEVLMTGSAVAFREWKDIDILRIDEDKETETFSKKFIPKEFKDKKFRVSYGFELVGNKGNLNFHDYQNLIEAEYENISFDINTETNKLIFPNEKAEKIEEASKYFLSLIEKAKEYVREEKFWQVERILKKKFKTEFSQMLERLEDVNF